MKSEQKRLAPTSWDGHCPWVILPGEPTKAFSAFSFYLDLPAVHRNQLAVTQAFEASRGTIANWMFSWAWDERLELWTRHVGKLAAAKRADTLSKLRVMEVDLAHNTLKLVTAEVAKYLTLALNSGDPILNPTQLAKLADFGMRLGRLLQGEPDQIIEKRVAIDVREERALLQQVIQQPELVDALDRALDGYSSNKLVVVK